MDTFIRKTAFLFILLLGVGLSGYAQSSGLYISGSVLDADSLQSLPGATIKNISSQKALQTDEEGFFKIDVRPGDTLLIQHMTYSPTRYVVPIDLKASQYALVQLMQKENVMGATNIHAFPTQLQFEQTLLQIDPGNLTTKDANLEINLERVTNDPTNMQKYLDDHMRYQQMYVVPERVAPNNFLNPDRWRNFIRDWREGRLTEEGMEKLEGFPARAKDFDDQ